MTWTSLSLLLLWVIVAVQSLVIVELLRQVGLIRRANGMDQSALFVEGEGLPRGTAAPPISGTGLRSGSVEEEWLTLGSRATMAIFLSTRCSACEELVPSLNDLRADHGRNLDLVAVVSSPSSDDAECRQLVRRLDPAIPVIFDSDQVLTRLYRVKRTPGATLISKGVVRIHGVVNRLEHLEALLREEVTLGPSEVLVTEPNGR